MTREDALRKLVPHGMSTSAMVTDAQQFIERLIALDLLKLEEPKSLPQKLRDFISDSRLAQGDAMERLGNLHDVLADCGLRIVEK